MDALSLPPSQEEALCYMSRAGELGVKMGTSFHAIVRGRVQGVFFRAFVRRHAMALGLTGYVRNLVQSKAVEVKAEGERSQLEELLKRLHEGPRRANVEEVEVTWADHTWNFSEFKVTKSA